MAACWEIAAHSAYDMFYKYKYLIVNLVLSHLGFWSGNFILIAPFPDRCLLVPFYLSKTSQIILDLHPGFSHMEDKKAKHCISLKSTLR